MLGHSALAQPRQKPAAGVPMRGQFRHHHLLLRALAMDSFSSWLSRGLTCLSKPLLLFRLGCPKCLFPSKANQSQQNQLDSCKSRVLGCCSQTTWGCNTQDGPQPPHPSWELWTTAEASPLFHSISRCDQIGRGNI